MENVSRPDPAEKEFYLQSFRNHCVLIQLSGAGRLEPVAPVIEELVANHTMLVVVGAELPASRGPLSLTRRQLSGAAGSLAELSGRLLEHGEVYVTSPSPARGARALGFARELALALGVRKVVVVDPRGGISGRRGPRSFVNAASLARLTGSRGGRTGWTRAELRELLSGVRRGIESINLTTAEGLAAELYTYEGAGTLLTAQEYCRVARLTIDQFHEARRLLVRGEREGFLLPRSEQQRARLLLSAYGAWFGDRRLAGVAGLEVADYAAQRLGEVVGLYTITRFKGEGVGVRILERLAVVGREAGLRALFACTSNQRAAAFFERQGFVRVPTQKAPVRKRATWPRGHLPAVLWYDL